jgi:hypothetical protein
MIGLTLEGGKHLLAALQVHLVQAQAEDHSAATPGRAGDGEMDESLS